MAARGDDLPDVCAPQDHARGLQERQIRNATVDVLLQFELLPRR
jgi:hypothetical protein